ncbi:MAG: uncharacterized protein KVP18_000110 [Porospora cf. gigantea A]|uniref:uncharacterized protein n=1 Tax=Porospora cf. gigantea A TaxID=2853593 RepID=UPI00355A6DF9|nr:MAG: hypothetical protein KVP18_000110 [Porospora cf. gigantea A]
MIACTTSAAAFSKVVDEPATPSTCGSEFSAVQYFKPFAPSDLMPIAFERSEAGQAYRESLLKDSVFLIVCGGSLNKCEHYRQLQSQYGVRFVLLDSKSSTSDFLTGREIVEAFLDVDMTPRPSMVAECVAAIQEYVESSGTVFRGIFTLWDDSVTLHSRICAHFNMPCSSVASVDIAHDKKATRDALEAAGLATPPHARVATEEELLIASERVGFPCVLKPVSGAASLGVYIVHDKKTLLSSFRKAITESQQCYESGYLMGLLFEDCEANVSQTAEDLHALILEGFVSGPEVDCDVVMDDGVVQYIMVSDDWPLVEPYLTEFGHNCPSQLPEEQIEALKVMAIKCCEAFGLTQGAFHIELKFDPVLGACLIELNARMGGGGVRYMHVAATGVDLGVESLFVTCGIPPRPITRQLAWSCSHEYFTARSGVVKADSRIFLEDIMKTMPSVKSVEGNLMVGDEVCCREEGFPSALGRLVVASTQSPAEAYAIGEYIRHLTDETFPIESAQ